MRAVPLPPLPVRVCLGVPRVQSTSYRGGSSTKAASDAFGAGLDFSLLSSVQQALGPKEA